MGYIIPAILSTVYDVSIFTILGTKVDMFTFVALMNTRIVMMSALEYFICNQTYVKSQKLAIGLLVQAGITVTLAGGVFKVNRVNWTSFLMVAVVIIVSCLIPIYNEKVLNQVSLTVWRQNLVLNSWSLLLVWGMFIFATPNAERVSAVLEALSSDRQVFAILAAFSCSVMGSYLLNSLRVIAQEVACFLALFLAAWVHQIDDHLSALQGESVFLLLIGMMLYCNSAMDDDDRPPNMEANNSSAPPQLVESHMLVYTVGCFDSFHERHKTFLERVRAHVGLNCKMIVGVYDDMAVCKLRNEPPKDTLCVRITNLKPHVDQVFVVPDEDPSTALAGIIDTSVPSSCAIYVHGDDRSCFPGQALLETMGVAVELLPETVGKD